MYTNQHTPHACARALMRVRARAHAHDSTCTHAHVHVLSYLQGISRLSHTLSYIRMPHTNENTTHMRVLSYLQGIVRLSPENFSCWVRALLKYMCVCECVYVCIYIYVWIYIHRYIYIYIPSKLYDTST
jgi:hypothetical protein